MIEVKIIDHCTKEDKISFEEFESVEHAIEFARQILRDNPRVDHLVLDVKEPKERVTISR